ncbi:MAG: DUF421 domain-containing protein [Gemmatimonadaceae bacterium]
MSADAAAQSISASLWQIGEPVLAKVIRTLVIYAFLVVGLRLAGRRELGQLNPFDLVVLLVLSNTVQNAIIGNDNSVTGGILGAVILLGVNYIVGRVIYHHPRVERVVVGRPLLLVGDGRLIRENLAREFITREEIAAAARRQGIDGLDDVGECWLETGGALTFIAKRPTPDEGRHAEVLARLEAIERRLAATGGER